MDDLLADFIAETREMLEASGGEIVAWEADPSDGARLDAIFRFVHTVKGNCGFFDFPRLERLSHAAEDALAECRAGRRQPDSALVSAVLAVIDRIGAMTDAIEATGACPEGSDDALIAALDADADTDDNLGPDILQGSEPDGEDPCEIADQAANRSGPAVKRTIRLPVDLLDEVMKGVSDMVLARNDLARRLRDAGEQPTIDGPFERLSAILDDVRGSTTRMRMQRLEHLFSSLPRLVRDLSNELGKQVMVDFEGGDVELDREMVEMVRDPLTHIIRNAIDHGIETPTRRRENGKREIGLLSFAARQSGNQITLVITDDGGGIDTERLGKKAVDAGLYTAAEIAAMDDERKLQLIFEPGLSTAAEVSAVSGRGVGMDVVRANIERVGGSIALASTPGRGTSFTLRLPLTLSILSALTVEARGQLYAIPRSFVEEVVLARSDSVELVKAGERQLLTFREKRVPCLALDHVLMGTQAGSIDWRRKTLIMIRLGSSEIFALAVDAVMDHEDVVVKPIAPAVMATKLYAGTTLLDDGRPMMLLDVLSIAAAHDMLAASREVRDVETAPDVQARPTISVMLYTGLDGRRRAVRLPLVRRIDTIDSTAIDVDGARAQVVVDGKLLTLVGHDHAPLPMGACRLLRLSDGESELALIVAEVHDATEIDSAIEPHAGDPAIEGILLHGDRPVPLLDGHALFARHHRPQSPSALTCRLPEGDSWAEGILRPLVEAAGYQIAPNADAAVDVWIASDRSEADTSDPGAAIIVLRETPEPASATDDSVYRYDREALLAQLQRVRRKEA